MGLVFSRPSAETLYPDSHHSHQTQMHKTHPLPDLPTLLAFLRMRLFLINSCVPRAPISHWANTPPLSPQLATSWVAPQSPVPLITQCIIKLSCSLLQTVVLTSSSLRDIICLLTHTHNFQSHLDRRLWYLHCEPQKIQLCVQYIGGAQGTLDG